MENCGFILNPEKKPEIEIALTVSEGELAESANQYDEDLQFATEAENEVPGLDTCYTPYQIKIQIPANSEKEVSLICHVEAEENISYDGVTKDLVKDTADLWHWGMDVTSHAAFTVLENNKNFFAELIKNADCKDELTEILTVASNQLLSHRESTGLTTVLAGLPWFTDWGRDTMIAFTGLVLSTGRFEKAEEILLTFAKYVDHGMVPNMFPDNGQDPLYNTVDASLWYFYAVHKYLEYNNKPEAYEFIKENIYPALKEIIEAYKKGTLFSIYMEEDGCLYDVIDGDDKDASIRPNQIYAVSLPYTMLDEAKAKAVVDVVKEKLFVGVGLRSLDPAHKEYHPIYIGALHKRDAAYHQGTAWGFIVGGFITAYTKVYGASAETAKAALEMLEPMKAHLYNNCVGSICEIFDGDAPHNGRGCYGQAWSVGETLRCHKEDILPYL